MDHEKLLEDALNELKKVATSMAAQTMPNTPMPRLRKFIFIFVPGRGEVSWPGFDGEHWRWEYLCLPKDRWGSFSSGAKNILLLAQHQPRLILRALRRIQAATAWCEARAEGRRRQAQEILRQQSRAVEALEAEAAMLALK